MGGPACACVPEPFFSSSDSARNKCISPLEISKHQPNGAPARIFFVFFTFNLKLELSIVQNKIIKNND